jgi:hypothetical protein
VVYATQLHLILLCYKVRLTMVPALKSLVTVSMFHLVDNTNSDNQHGL